jgi:translation initiation factor IF-1
VRGEAAARRSVEGVVVAQLPSGLYQVTIGDAEARVTAHIGGGRERNFVRLLVGDRVELALTARDRTRARVLRKI